MNNAKPYKTAEEMTNLLRDLFSKNVLVKKAYELSLFSHRFKKRDDGVPYVNQHIFPLVFDVFEIYKDSSDLEIAIMTTLLHDVPEDDFTCPMSRVEKEFGKEVADVVGELQKEQKTSAVRTQADKHQEHVEMVEKLKKSSKMAQVIKILDRINNTVCTDVYRNPVKYARFIQDTEELYIPFAKTVNEGLAAKLEAGLAQIKADLHS